MSSTTPEAPEAASAINIAPETPEFFVNPDPAYQWLHANAPVYWHAPQQLWVLSRWDDVRYVSSHPELFSSSRGIMPHERGGFERFAGAAGNDARFSAPRLSLIGLDPPEHVRYRKIVNRVFTPRMVAGLEPKMRGIVKRCARSIKPGEVTDFVAALSEPLPLEIIAHMLGVSAEDREDFRRWSNARAVASATVQGAVPDRAEMIEQFEYFGTLLDERQRRPHDDLLSLLLTAKVEGESLSRSELLMFCTLLLAAGNETTRNLVSGGALALVQHPAEKAKLVKDPSLIPRAVEEMLRWVTPVRFMCRTAVVDMEIGSTKIAADEFVMMLYSAVNRDPGVYSDPFVFDVSRSQPSPHLTFGFGEHLCLGASLARLEATVIFEEVLSRFPSIELAGEVERIPTAALNAIKRMPVTLGR